MVAEYKKVVSFNIRLAKRSYGQGEPQEIMGVEKYSLK